MARASLIRFRGSVRGVYLLGRGILDILAYWGWYGEGVMDIKIKSDETEKIDEKTLK